MRSVPPVHSPLPLRAVGAGARGLLGGPAEARVVAELRAHYHPRDLLRTDSGTTALTLALSSLKQRRPDRPIALPAFCCYDVATAADGAAVPVALYDVDPHTLGPDLASLRRILVAGVSGVVIAHLYGVPVDLGAVRALAEEHGGDIILIDDAAQGAGASYESRPLGTFGSFGVLSFGRGKGMTGGGAGGGALLGNDAAGAAAIGAMRAGGVLAEGKRGAKGLALTAAQWLLGRPSLYGIPASLPFLRLGETIYRAPSRPAQPTASSAAILGVTWPLGPVEADARRANAHRLLQALAGRRREWPIRVPPNAIPGYLRLPLLLPAGSRDRVAAARALGVMPGYPRALVDLEGFGHRTVNPRSETYAGARLLAERLCTLPTHSLLTEGDLRRLERWLGSAPE